MSDELCDEKRFLDEMRAAVEVDENKERVVIGRLPSDGREALYTEVLIADIVDDANGDEPRNFSKNTEDAINVLQKAPPAAFSTGAESRGIR